MPFWLVSSSSRSGQQSLVRVLLIFIFIQNWLDLHIYPYLYCCELASESMFRFKSFYIIFLPVSYQKSLYLYLCLFSYPCLYLFLQGGSLTLRVWVMTVGGAAATVILDRFSLYLYLCLYLVSKKKLVSDSVSKKVLDSVSKKFGDVNLFFVLQKWP